MSSGIAPRSSLAARDRAVVELVGRFRQLSAAHIGAVLFAERASQTPLDRCLKRLTERRFLARLARPIGGDGGGSAQFVYQLGRVGWQLLGRTGAYWVPRTSNRHVLAVADCYVGLLSAERAGALKLLTFAPEPYCHTRVRTTELTPDVYTEVGVPALYAKFRLWLEVDRGTEHGSVIKDKCVRYWQAYQVWDEETFPYVVFVVPDEKRQREIRRVVAGGPAEAQALFRAVITNRLTEKISTGIEP